MNDSNKHMLDPAHQIVAQQLLTELEINNLQRLLGAVGIEMLVLKGPHLGNTVYDDPAERSYGDLDILVRPAQHELAVLTLVDHDYTVEEYDSNRKETARVGYNTPLRTPRGLLVELHRHLSQFNRYPVDTDRLFAEAITFEIGNVTARGLRPEHLIVHLVIHVLKSYFIVEHKHFKDIALVSHAGPLDWSDITSLIKAAGAATGGYYVLLAARELCGAQVPAAVLARLRPGWLRRTWLGWHLAVDRFPVYRGDCHNTTEVQLRLALPLVDKKCRWPALVGRYTLVRLLDGFQ